MVCKPVGLFEINSEEVDFTYIYYNHDYKRILIDFTNLDETNYMLEMSEAGLKELNNILYSINARMYGFMQCNEPKENGYYLTADHKLLVCKDGFWAKAQEYGKPTPEPFGSETNPMQYVDWKQLVEELPEECFPILKTSVQAWDLEADDED